MLKMLVLLKNPRLEKLTLCSNKLMVIFVVFSDVLWSFYAGFNFIDLKGKECTIVLKWEKDEHRDQAGKIAKYWNQKFGKQKCKCQVVLEK